MKLDDSLAPQQCSDVKAAAKVARGRTEAPAVSGKVDNRLYKAENEQASP